MTADVRVLLKGLRSSMPGGINEQTRRTWCSLIDQIDAHVARLSTAECEVSLWVRGWQDIICRLRQENPELYYTLLPRISESLHRNTFDLGTVAVMADADAGYILSRLAAATGARVDYTRPMREEVERLLDRVLSGERESVVSQSSTSGRAYQGNGVRVR